jgi:TonB family protein
VLLPDVPTATVTERDTTNGKVAFHSFAVRLPDAFYQVGYSDFTGLTDQEIFNGARKILTTATGVSVFGEREISIDKHSGTEWRLVQDGVAFGIRQLLVINGRQYQINMLVPLEKAFNNGQPSMNVASQTQSFTEASTRFLNSFKFTEPAVTSSPALIVPRCDPDKVVTMVGTLSGSADAKQNKAITGDVVNGQAIRLVQPEYPAIALAAHAAGQVKVQVVIDCEGNVAKAAVVEGNPLLWDAALKAARESKFTPTQWKGQPVMVSGIIIYNFVAQ